MQRERPDVWRIAAFALAASLLAAGCATPIEIPGADGGAAGNRDAASPAVKRDAGMAADAAAYDVFDPSHYNGRSDGGALDAAPVAVGDGGGDALLDGGGDQLDGGDAGGDATPDGAQLDASAAADGGA